MTKMEDKVVRAIQPHDNVVVAVIIRTVMPGYGTAGPGFAIHNDEMDDMIAAYASRNCAYFLCSIDGNVIGGGGIAPLKGVMKITVSKRRCTSSHCTRQRAGPAYVANLPDGGSRKRV